MTDASIAPDVSPGPIEAVLFDMDGVVTDTARAHASAWKRLFDQYLEQRAGGRTFEPFDADVDYLTYVDGKPRFEGVRSFLASRGIELPYGSDTDAPDAETVCGLGNRKNGFFNDWLASNQVPAFPSTVAFIHKLKGQGIKVGLFTSSRNAEAVLTSGGVRDLFDVRIDGVEAAEKGLPGKPKPDVLIEAAKRLGAEPGRTAIVEDAISGVQAGRAGSFAFVIGVDREDQAEALKDGGADVVVPDLAAIRLETDGRIRVKSAADLPTIWDCEDEIRARLDGKAPAIFLDYDGTLTPIVEDPAKAIITEDGREIVAALADKAKVTIVSGRDIPLLKHLLKLDQVFYAGSHGYEIEGPAGWHDSLEQGTEFLSDLDAVEKALMAGPGQVPGCQIERKRYECSVHYRRVAEADRPTVDAETDRVLEDFKRLKKGGGKMVYRIQPRFDWDKGKAVMWVMSQLDLDPETTVPIYCGDDLTDEDAFIALAGRGIAVVVRDRPRPTSADYALDDPADVLRFLEFVGGFVGGASR